LPRSTPTPLYVVGLESVYGAPSRAGFGGAVFYEPALPAADLERVAQEKYRYFVGALWERLGKKAWLSAWRPIYSRAARRRDIVAELQTITDRDARLSVPLILRTAQARQALANAYNHDTVAQLAVYKLSDGAALSGLLIAGRRDSGEAVFLVFLLD
jgi:hypothetical protein